MITFEILKQSALAFPEVTEENHFEKISFRIKKKIFITYDQQKNRACLKLSMIDQNVYSLSDKVNIYPVENKWGLQGWTFIDLKNVNEEIFQETLTAAYKNVSKK
jgi:predicted DNA-binding protein (MmcQ/YjbR family)